MASIYDVKPKFQSLLRPCTRWLAGSGVTPNHVTVTALVLSFGVGGLVWWWDTSRWPLLVVPVFLFVRMALNAMDGMLAREHNLTSDLGAVLNELGDVLSDAALYLPFARLPGLPAGLIVVVVVLGVISEMTGVIAVQIGASRRYDGPMGKSDRAFVFGLVALLLGLGVPAGRWLAGAFGVVLALLVVTVVNRARKALREVG